MSAEAIADVIRAHQPSTGMSVASGVTCRCGYWNGDERGGVNRPVGFQGLMWHQAQELTAAGYGLVADAKREAWAEGYSAGFWDAKGSSEYRSIAFNPYRKASNDDQ